MISAAHLRNHVIQPVLERLDMDSLAAENLLLGTAAVETELGTYLVQLSGPALGIYQVEPATYYDLLTNWLPYRAHVQTLLLPYQAREPEGVEQLVGNLYFATAVARCIYRRVPERLPDAEDVAGMARYWKRYWNTPKGKGTVEKFVNAYARCVGAA